MQWRIWGMVNMIALPVLLGNSLRLPEGSILSELGQISHWLVFMLRMKA